MCIRVLWNPQSIFLHTWHIPFKPTLSNKRDFSQQIQQDQRTRLDKALTAWSVWRVTETGCSLTSLNQFAHMPNVLTCCSWLVSCSDTTSSTVSCDFLLSFFFFFFLATSSAVWHGFVGKECIKGGIGDRNRGEGQGGGIKKREEA